MARSRKSRETSPSNVRERTSRPIPSFSKRGMIASVYLSGWCDKVFFRSEYFKRAEAFKTATQNTTKVFEVKECPSHVLEIVINYMYGIDLPSDLSTTYLEDLLFMADLYLMDDLKVVLFDMPNLNQYDI